MHKILSSRNGLIKIVAASLLLLTNTALFAVIQDVEVTGFEVLENPVSNIEQAINSKSTHVSGQLKFGYTDKAHWARFSLPPGSAGNYVVINFRCLDYVSIYYVSNGIAHDSVLTGYLRPLSSREMPLTRFVMKLPEDAATSDWVYLKIQKNEGTLRTKVFLQDEGSLENATLKEERVITFVMGMSLLMLLFALAYFLHFRMTIFLWYMLFLFSFDAFQLSNYGYGSLYVWGDNYWLSNIARGFWQIPTLFAGLIFAYKLLRVKEFCFKTFSRLYHILLSVLMAEFVLMLLPLPTYPWRFLIYLLHICCTFAALFFFIYASAQAIKHRHTPAYYFIFGEIILLLAFLYLALFNFNIPPAFVFIDYAIFYAGILSMCMGLISMISYTRLMHVVKVPEKIFIPVKPEPKTPDEDELKKASEIFSQLQDFFVSTKPYLNDHISIESLSEQVNLPAHLISKAINLKAGKHFFDYVNSFRIEEAKKLLQDDEVLKTYNINGIAFLSGFSNKTSFNRAFKKFTGKTPSAYRDACKNQVVNK